MADDYLTQLRKLVGKRKLITPGVRGILFDADRRVLLIHRRDTGKWALPSGGLELEESIFECLQREMREETGLNVKAATVIAIYSHPRYSATNAAGEEQQKLTIVFRVDDWAGQLKRQSPENDDACFFPLNVLPELPGYHQESLLDVQAFEGTLILK